MPRLNFLLINGLQRECGGYVPVNVAWQVLTVMFRTGGTKKWTSPEHGNIDGSSIKTYSMEISIKCQDLMDKWSRIYKKLQSNTEKDF